MRVREAAAQDHRPQSIELLLRPGDDELELWSGPDDSPARRWPSRAHFHLVPRVEADQDVANVLHRFCEHALQREPGLALDFRLVAFAMHGGDAYAQA